MNQRPQFKDVDAWGLTHTGHVRKENQDHFLVGSLIRGVNVDHTSVAEEDQPLLQRERLASLAMVADGVGSLAGGGDAARLAVRGLVASVARFFHGADEAERDDPEVFPRLLHDAALACHESLLQKAEQEGGRMFATTLTLFLGLWPHAYLLQVGDSRCYIYQARRLTQITRDQTLAQELVDSGVLSRIEAERSRWAHVLSSAIGGSEAVPVVTRVVRERGAVVLLCSDGLTRHVTEQRIAERLESMSSSRQAAEQLLQDALDGGGSDNITVVIGRTLMPES